MFKLSFSEFIAMKEFEEQSELQEKLIVYGGGKKYGQIVFMAGGAGSGKGFAISNFVNSSDFRVRDVDELKLAFQKLDAVRKFTTEELLLKYKANLSEKDLKHIETHVLDKGYSLRDLDLRTPEHVYALHVIVAATGTKDKTLDLLLASSDRRNLPNIIFDTTFKDMKELQEVVPRLLEVGYQSRDIHITWVLTNYEIAIKNNAKRARVVPADIMLKTHTGAAQTVMNLVKDGVPSEVDGGFYVILNNPENTMFADDPKTGKHHVNVSMIAKDKKERKIVSSFTYLTLKKPGKSLTSDTEVKKQLYAWVTANVPKESLDQIAMDKL